MQLNLPIKTKWVGLIFLLVACARSAPNLPDNNFSIRADDSKISCSKISTRKKEIKEEKLALENTIKGNRQDNQTIGYVSAITIPAFALATESNSAEKKKLDDLQKEFDLLIYKEKQKNC